MLLLANPTFTAEFRIGAAAVDTTPPLGMPMAGYYHARGADGVLDPLFSKALIIESEGQRVALVVVDIISLTKTIVEQARAEIEKTTGIPAGQVMISATHTHTGPELANRNRRSSDMGGQKQIAQEYTERLPKLIAASVQQASQALQPARLSVAKEPCEGLAFNRRYYMSDGTVGWNPGKLNPKIVMPAGVTDPEVRILYAERTNGLGPMNALLTYVNFAMHPDTTSGSKLSADWPGALSRLLGSYHRSGGSLPPSLTNRNGDSLSPSVTNLTGDKLSPFLTIVANGTCGNLNHVDVSTPWAGSGTYEQQRIAAILGASVFNAYKHLKAVSGGALRARSEIVELALPEVTPEQLEEARQTVAATKDDRGGNFMKLVRAYRALDVAGREGKPHHVEVQVIACGTDIAWVALPGEIFVELGLAIKKKSPFAQTFLVELANDNLGYIPDRRSYAEGNYEPESSRCAAGSGEKLVEAAVKMLLALHQEAGGTIYSYGTSTQR